MKPSVRSKNKRTNAKRGMNRSSREGWSRSSDRKSSLNRRGSKTKRNQNTTTSMLLNWTTKRSLRWGPPPSTQPTCWKIKTRWHFQIGFIPRPACRRLTTLPVWQRPTKNSFQMFLEKDHSRPPTWKKGLLVAETRPCRLWRRVSNASTRMRRF